MGLVKSPKDLWAAMIYIALGAVVLYVGADYRMGTAGRMGPGYFPKVLAWLLIGVGLLSLARSFVHKGESVDRVVWATVIGAVLLPTALVFAFGASPARASAFFGSLSAPIGGPQALVLIAAIACVVGAIFSPAARPLLLLSLACVVFSWLLPRVGFGISLAALCLISASASREFRFDFIATAGLLALIFACAAVFVKGLGVPMPLWGTWLEPYVGGLPQWLR